MRAVLMSGYDKSEAMESFETNDHVIFLQKPFKPSKLNETLLQILSDS